MTLDEREIRWAFDLVEARDYGSSILVETRADANDDGTTTFVASTDAPDRAMDVVKQNWKLAAFRSNPVILDNHDTRRVVGRAVDVSVPKAGDDAGKLIIRVEWDGDSPDPSIRNVGHQHRRGFRKAGSVGFRAGKKTRRDKLPTDHEYYQAPIEVETYWGTEKYAGTLFEAPELLEFSSATIPMNAQALQRSLGLHRRAEGDPPEGDDPPADDDPWADEAYLARAVDALWPILMARAKAALFPEDEEADEEAPKDEAVAEMAMRRLVRPTVLDVLRSDAARRIVGAYGSAGPAPTTDLYARVAALLEQT